MKKTLMLMMTVVLCIAAVTSCKKKPEPVADPEIKISGATEIALPADAASGTITFTANRDWTADAGAAWAKVSPASGKASDKAVTLTVTCEANANEKARTTTVTITAGTASKTVTITQAGTKEDPGPGPGPTTVAVTGISFENDEYTVGVGNTLQLTATIAPEDATDKTVVWSVSDESVATVSESGAVKGLTAGTAKVRASTPDGTIYAECTVTVTEDVQGSHQGAVTDDMYGGSGSGGDDVSGGSGASQGDEESDKNGFQYKFSDKTVNVTEALQAKMESVSSEGFALPADPQGNSAISNGDVFVFPPSEEYPGGRAVKVTGVKAEGDDYYTLRRWRP